MYFSQIFLSPERDMLLSRDAVRLARAYMNSSKSVRPSGAWSHLPQKPLNELQNSFLEFVSDVPNWIS